MIAACLLGLISSFPLSKRIKGAAFLLGNAEDAGNVSDGIGAGIDLYKMYTGDGSAAAGWPAKDQWVSFKDMQDLMLLYNLMSNC